MNYAALSFRYISIKAVPGLLQQTGSPGHTRLTPSGYLIEYDQVLEERPEELSKLLLHELGHIARGDLLARPGDIDHETANIAQDAIINSTHGITSVMDLPGVTLGSVMDVVGNRWPDYIPGWREVAEALKEHRNRPRATCGIEYSPADPARIAAHIKALAELRKQAQGDPRLEEILRAGMGLPLGGTMPYAPPKPIPPVIRRIWESAQGGYAVPIRRRGWIWEHPSVPELRGTGRRRLCKILIAVDASGSVQPYIERILGVARYIREHELALACDVLYFADRISTRYEDVAGGGTLVGPVAERAVRGGYDVLVIVTDREYADPTALDPARRRLRVVEVDPRESSKE